MKIISPIKRVSQQQNYLSSIVRPSPSTKKVLKLANEINLIEKQTEFIKDNGIKREDFQSLNKKKLNIL